MILSFHMNDEVVTNPQHDKEIVINTSIIVHKAQHIVIQNLSG